MKSEMHELSMSPEQRYRRIIHPAMALLPSVLPALLVGLSLSTISGTGVHPLLMITFTLIASTTALISGYIFRKERAGIYSGLRGFLLLFGSLYAGYSLTRSGELLERFQPSAAHALLLLPAFYAWISSGDIMKRLEDRLLVLTLKEGVPRKDLNAVMRDNYDVVGSTINGMRSLQGYSNAVLLISALYSMVIILTAGEVYLSLFLIFPLMVAGFFWFRSQVVQFWQELSLAAEGIPLPAEQLKEQSRIGWYILIAAGVFSIAVARGPILPAELLLAPLLWLANLLENEEVSAAVIEQMSRMEAGPPSPGLEFSGEITRREPGWIVTVLFPLLYRMLRYAVFIGLGIFLLAPFFSRSFRAIVRRYGFLRSIAAAIRYVFLLIWSELRALLPGFDDGSGNYRRVRKKLSSGRRVEWEDDDARLSRKKRRELDMLSKSYESLMTWAVKRGIHVRSSDPPQGFGKKISTIFPGLEMQTARFIDIFEEGFYSERELSAAVIQEYSILLREIRHTRS